MMILKLYKEKLSKFIQKEHLILVECKILMNSIIRARII
jgi:hypothetical protein